MEQVNDRFIPQSFEEIETINKRLRETKSEWIEEKPSKGQTTYLGHNTMRQILDIAVKGITYWDFNILEQWKEEIYAFNKNNNTWYFDGYVYHVKGSMYIPGIGRREQYGAKAAIGGKDNQDSAYKAAASNCFTKCASLFGVGEEIYSKIKVEAEQEQPQQIQQPQTQQQQQQVNPFVNQHQVAYNQPQGWPQQQQIDPQMQQQQQAQQQWSQQQQFNPQQQMNQQQWGQQQNGNFNQGQQAQAQQQPNAGQNNIQQDMLEVDRMIYNQNVGDIPFENVPPTVEEKQPQQNQIEATPNIYSVEEQKQAEPNNYNASGVEYGAPANSPESKESQSIEKPKVDVQENTNQGTNPWQEQGVIQELQNYASHKKRLKIEDDSLMIPYLRDYFKDENATTELLTPENLKGFNQHLQNVSV